MSVPLAQSGLRFITKYVSDKCMRIVVAMVILIMMASTLSGCFGGEQKHLIKDTSTILDGGRYYMAGTSDGRVTGYDGYAWELTYTAQPDSSSGFSWNVYVLEGVNCDNFEDSASFIYTTLTWKDMTGSGSRDRQTADSNDALCFIVDNTDGHEPLEFEFKIYGWN